MSVAPGVLAMPGAVRRMLLDQVPAGSAHRLLQKPNIRRLSGRDVSDEQTPGYGGRRCLGCRR